MTTHSRQHFYEETQMDPVAGQEVMISGWTRFCEFYSRTRSSEPDENRSAVKAIPASDFRA